MPRLAWDELEVFLDDFAFPATVSGGRTFPAIIDEEYEREGMGGFVMTTAQPTLVARETDLKGLKKQARITVQGVNYWLVDDPRPDGTGMSTAPLSRSNLIQDDAAATPVPKHGAGEQWPG